MSQPADHRSAVINRIKIFCILGIFIMHVALTFTYVPTIYPFWIFDVSSPSLILTGMSSFLNSVCMPLFFFLAGTLAHKYFIDSNARHFIARGKKWFFYLLITWPLVTGSILLSCHLADIPIHWVDMVFPKNKYNQSWMWLPFNFFHLWFLVCLMLFEWVAALIIWVKLRIKLTLGWSVLAVIIIHALAAFSTDEGFLLTPIVFHEKTLFTVLAYLSWYMLGLHFSIRTLHESIGWFFKNAIVFFTVVILYFVLKYMFFTLHKDLQPLVWGALVLCDALVVLCVFGFFLRLDEHSSFFTKIRLFKSPHWHQWILKNQLGIYILQIPVIFLLFSVTNKFTIVKNATTAIGRQVTYKTENVETWTTYAVFIGLTAGICLVLLVLVRLMLGKSDRSMLES